MRSSCWEGVARVFAGGGRRCSWHRRGADRPVACPATVKHAVAPVAGHVVHSCMLRSRHGRDVLALDRPPPRRSMRPRCREWSKAARSGERRLWRGGKKLFLAPRSISDSALEIHGAGGGRSVVRSSTASSGRVWRRRPPSGLHPPGSSSPSAIDHLSFSNQAELDQIMACDDRIIGTDIQRAQVADHTQQARIHTAWLTGRPATFMYAVPEVNHLGHAWAIRAMLWGDASCSKAHVSNARDLIIRCHEDDTLISLHNATDWNLPSLIGPKHRSLYYWTERAKLNHSSVALKEPPNVRALGS